MTICNRMSEFSTPSKNQKGRKLKLILDSEEKTEESLSLKEIKLIKEPCYTSMKV